MRNRLLLVLVLLAAPTAASARPRFGDPLPGMAASELGAFLDGKDEFREVDEAPEGLGPTFNLDGCAACHDRPAVGGGSRIVETRFGRTENDVFDPLSAEGGSLLQELAIDPACAEVVPGDANVVALRQTTPLFGAGLVEAIPDAQITARAAAEELLDAGLAGRAHLVTSVSDGQVHVGRFGWKAQQALLLDFSGDAYVNEMGITNRLFPQENAPNGNLALLALCDTVEDPEDVTDDIDAFTDFMRFLAPPPQRSQLSQRIQRGAQVFVGAGCAFCHYTGYVAASPRPAIDGRTVEAFSDFLLHDIGTGDGVVQGDAQGTEFRTAPLWGLRRSAPYLHDGSASTVSLAIESHAGQAAAARDAFLALPSGDRRAMLRFLRTL
jgi:CxxC motif-containing protein (DUF1111 family)